MKSLSKILICTLIIIFNQPASAAYKKDTEYRLTWPKLQLSNKDGERVYTFNVLLSCAHFSGVTKIPNDWSLQIVSPVSMKTSLSANADHGASSLANLNQFNNSVNIVIDEPSCFSISAEIETYTNDVAVNHKFTIKELKLVP